MKNYVKNEHDSHDEHDEHDSHDEQDEQDEHDDPNKHKLMFFEGLILGGLGGVIFNQLITNTDANIATSNGQTLNEFYGED